MATIINNPGPNGENNGGSAGMIIALIVAIVVIALFVIYGLPAMRGTNNNDTTPDTTTEINVPDSIDVNMNDGTEN